MGGKPSGKMINSGWGSHHARQESRQPRRGNVSRTGSHESRASSRLSSSSTITTAELLSHSSLPSSRITTYDAPSSMTSTAEPPSHSSVASLRTNTSRSNAFSSLTTTEWLSGSAIRSVNSGSNLSESEGNTSRRAVVAHNDVLRNRHLHPTELLRRPNYRKGSWENVVVKFKQQVPRPENVSLPSATVLKINCAGAFSASSHQAGFGAVIRTQEGHFLAAFSGKLVSCQDAIVAEICAIMQGLWLADCMMLQEVEVRSDSFFVITELQNPSNSRFAFPYHLLLNEVKRMGASFRNCKFRHIKEEANSVAHQLAMCGFVLGTIQSWIYTAPSFLLPALQQDVYLGYTF